MTQKTAQIRRWRRRYDYFCQTCDKHRYTVNFERKRHGVCTICDEHFGQHKNQMNIFEINIQHMPTVNIRLHPVSTGKTIRYVPHSVNTKMHWATKAKWKKQWENEVANCIMENRKKFHKLPLELGKIKVVYYQCKDMDQDNLRGSVKPILDGLVKCGVLVDDSPKYLDHTVEQKKVKKIKDQHVEINFYLS